MDCKELTDILSDKVLAELTAHERAGVAAHVAECSACKQEWGLDQESQDLHTAAEVLDAHNSVKDAVMARITGSETGHPLDAAAERQDGPEKLDGYELLGKLGRGGMGVVYKARQISVDRIVAVKILPQRLSHNEVYLERFFREARSAARMNHSNIVQAIDAGFDRGYHYFVMEHVDGPSVADRLRRDGVLDEKEALQVTRDIAAALAHAEKHNIVHRDIKPQNIMLTSDGVAKLADLGLAKRSVEETGVVTATEGVPADRFVTTAEGHAVGTPLYMSPEQASGERNLDTRSDIYSLGATLLHMVTGVVPFDDEATERILSERQTQSAPSPEELRPDLSPATCRLIRRMMAYDVAERYQSAEELLTEVDTILLGQTPISEAPTDEELAAQRRSVSRVRTSRVLLIFLAMSAVILMTVGAFIAMSDRSQASRVSEPEQEQQRLTAELALARTWIDLFDGKSLNGWEAVERFPREGEPGEVRVRNGEIILERGNKWSAISCTRGVLSVDYELELDAMRVEGNGSFCCMVFPVSGLRATLEVGGLGGDVVGIAGLDGKHADANETTKRMKFQNGRWYRMRLRVTESRIEFWIDGEAKINLNTTDRRFGVPITFRGIRTLGMGSSQTKAALRNIRLRRVDDPVSGAGTKQD